MPEAPKPARSLFAPAALLPAGWATDVRIDIDAAGDIVAVMPGAAAEGAERTAGPVLPGMPNLHSHAFQRAMAGLAEYMGSPQDSFWTWRDLMYRFVARIGPEEAEAIAARLYVECLKQGFTAVCEFHYLHNAPGGARYADPAEMSRRVVAAARGTGMGITHLPVLYAFGGFGEKPLSEAQARFRSDPEFVLGVAEAVRKDAAGDPDITAGVAPHSLRAASPAMLAEAVAGLTAADAGAPVHIHIAEQVKEVEDCLAWSARRPVEWLMENAAVDARWCLVHATHMTEAETDALAAAGAVAGLCPTTEANLGDGLFPLPRYLAQGGVFGIGTDSHVGQSPVEELRLLEYGQRLALRRRNVAASEISPSVGRTLWEGALRGGAQATGRRVGRIAPGCRADLIVLDADHPNLAGRGGDRLLDALVFAGNDRLVRDVMTGGQWRVRDGRHAMEEEAAARYTAVLERLLD